MYVTFPIESSHLVDTELRPGRASRFKYPSNETEISPLGEIYAEIRRGEMLKECDFEKQGCQVGEMKKIEEKSDLHFLRSLSSGNGRCNTA